MIEDAGGSIEYDEHGSGPTVVLVPGSCSTGAAWRPVIAAWNGQFRYVTTSLLGYGRTAERRTPRDPSISHEVDMLEQVIRKAGGRVHLVGHSFGGLVALALALRNQTHVASLAIAEAPAPEILRHKGEHHHYRTFRRMTDAYFADFDAGNRAAIGAMIDFYGGAGTFASWPPRVRDYAIDTTPINLLDWAGAYGFPLSGAALAAIEIPVLVLWGAASHPAVQRANALLAECMSATVATIQGAAHFMISTHADEVGDLIAQHVRGPERGRMRFRPSLGSCSCGCTGAAAIAPPVAPPSPS